MLRRELSSVIGVVPRGDKVSRAQAVVPQIESGNVHLPGAPSASGKNFDRSTTPAWVGGLIEEAAGFPRGANDDQVDAVSQALGQLAEREPRVWIM